MQIKAIEVLENMELNLLPMFYYSCAFISSLEMLSVSGTFEWTASEIAETAHLFISTD